jgi:hypothetical protein
MLRELLFLSSAGLHVLAQEIKVSPCWRGSMAGGLEERTIAISQPRTRCTDGGVIPLRLWEEMLHLIYGGNADQAWELFERAWPSDLPDKREVLKDFRKTLAQSIYWEDSKELNVGLQ